MGFLVVRHYVDTSGHSITVSRTKIDAVPHFRSSSYTPLSSIKAYSGVSLCGPGSLAITDRYLQRGFFKGSRCEGNRASKTARIEEGDRNEEQALKDQVRTLDGAPETDLKDVEGLKTALAVAQAGIASAEGEKTEALKALAQAEAKLQEYAATVVQGTESALREMQAAKESFNMELQGILEQKLTVESELVLAKQDALELAVRVDKVADSIIKETTANIAEDAMLKIAAARTSAAEAAHTVEEKIRTATVDTANAMIKETRDAIEKSFAALEAAKDKAQKSEIALFQRMQILDDMVLKEASALGLQQSASSLQRQLQAAESEIQRLQAEVKAVLARCEAAESRATAADEVLKQFQETANQSAQEHEESTKRALEALKVAGAARLEAARSAFKSDIEALQAALNTVQKAEKSQEQAYSRRYQALERALAAAEALTQAWQERALAVEGLLRKFKSEGADAVEVSGGIEGALTGGRMGASLGNESRKWDLLANGPRRDTPDWMVRRIEVALQGLPPRKFGQAEEEIGKKLDLPGIEEVWCIATAKVKEDVYTQQAAEKEAIDEQRRVLEKTLKKKAGRRPQKVSESGTGSGREIVLQGFNWESWRKKWYLELGPKAADLSSCGITTIWFPPPTQSVSPQGYMPGDLYNLNSAYGTVEELKNCIEEMHNHDLLVLGDAVLNHRCAQHKGPNGVWNVFGGKLSWGPEAIVRDDPNFQGRGNPSNGKLYGPFVLKSLIARLVKDDSSQLSDFSIFDARLLRGLYCIGYQEEKFEFTYHTSVSSWISKANRINKDFFSSFKQRPMENTVRVLYDSMGQLHRQLHTVPDEVLEIASLCYETLFTSADTLTQAVQDVRGLHSFRGLHMPVDGYCDLLEQEYVDDTMLFSQYAPDTLDRLQSALSVFGCVSGSLINWHKSSGDFFHAAPNIDHSQDFVRRDIIEWMKWLRTEIGYDGWRLDFVRGFWGGYVKEYIEATSPAFAIGEYWDSLAYEGGNVCYNQDAHRQRIVNWVNASGGTSSAFDVTTKGILHAALHNEYWRLIDPQGKPPGVMGWWPSRAVTFLENHDTGSTQGHWPFPRDKLMQGYAYILTHPGTPVIFYDHFYDFGLRDPIAELIAVRNRTGVHCRSTVKIHHATNEGYVAQIGENLVIKLGYLDWNPSKQNNLEGNWQRCLDKGSDYQIWERS
ncbi:hypothetical protein L7F22_056744 [Adiantum nelumboides]|nr:hypothetical protein [Adiantum nelumboides]